MKLETNKREISQALKQFNTNDLRQNSLDFLKVLGYSSDNLGDINSVKDFIKTYDQNQDINNTTALSDDWQSINLLFQLTAEDLFDHGQLNIFDTKQEVNNTIIESYLFIVIALNGSVYNRGDLSKITRSINRLFPMPVMVLFRYGDLLSIAIIHRRINKKDESKDVLEKITLIKDINIENPHRADVEILSDLSLEQLKSNYTINNFVDLHNAWQKTLDISKLNKRFFKEVSDWYFWATENVCFPDGALADENVRNATSIIRLITRLIFVWFIKEKGLISDRLFQLAEVQRLLKSWDDQDSNYYRAILQNLFFATLNTEMNTAEKPDNRKFRNQGQGKGSRDQNFMSHNLYRYEEYFREPQEFLKLCDRIPFLNGGLFECLDRDEGASAKPRYIRIDGFSDRADNVLRVPNFLFFVEKSMVDLNKFYGVNNKKFEVRGLINIFYRYKFTIDENTPIEEEVALDPELLGKVFENLLAAYNPETETTARKQTGSFYTPREIVNYMVDESLIAYLKNELLKKPVGFVEFGSEQIDLFGNEYRSQLTLQENIDPVNWDGRADELEEKLRLLFSFRPSNPFEDDSETTDRLIIAINNLKIFDPACGSGAFPMGILQKLVFILSKLDPNNEKWREQQKQKEIQPVLRDIQIAQKISYEEAQEQAINKLQERLRSIEENFDNNEMDYPRKLFLIENCIYGVDIQPIAVQISKLRFFISLIVEQKIDDSKPNRGILPLPNLETKFVAANSLIGIDTQLSLRSLEVEEKEAELQMVRQKHFTARTPKTKQKYRQEDQRLRQEISQLLKSTGLKSATADTLARWNPYDQNLFADFFSSEWMFGIKDGFDIVIGNPPYKLIGRDQLKEQELFKKRFSFSQYKINTYLLFLEQGLYFLRSNKSELAFIIPKSLVFNTYFENTRKQLLSKYAIPKIVEIQEEVFKNAVVGDNIIFFVQLSDDPLKNILHYQKVENIENINSNFVEIYSEKQEILLNSKQVQFYKSNFVNINKQTRLLEDLCIISNGLNPGNVKHILLSNKKETEHHQKMLLGKDINRYLLKWSGTWINYNNSLKNILTIEDTKSKQGMTAQKKVDFALRNQNIYNPDKILVRKTSDHIISSYDKEGFYFDSLAYSIQLRKHIKFSIKYILGILNSKLINYLYQNISDNKGKVFAKVLKNHLVKLPIADVSLPQQQPIIKLVDEILKMKNKNSDADTSELEKKIDQIVYQLYDLTETEINIIEEATQGK